MVKAIRRTKRVRTVVQPDVEQLPPSRLFHVALQTTRKFCMIFSQYKLEVL